MDWEKVFGNLLTLTVAFIAIAFMVAIAIQAVRNILRNLREAEKKDDKKKDL